VSGELSQGDGDAWSVAADSQVLDSKLRLRGEYAETSYDFDGVDSGEGRLDDDAHSLLAVYQPMQGKMIKGQPVTWELGTEYQNIGTFFRSLANPALPGDRELVRAFTNFNWTGLNLQAQAGREEDNVNDSPLLPKLRKELVTVAGSYTPTPDPDATQEQSKSFWGQPTFSGGIQYSKDKTIETPVGFQGSEVDIRTRNAQLMAYFSHDTWDWSIGHNVGWQDDETNLSPDTRNDLTDLAINLRIGERLSLGLQGQYNVIDDRSGGADSTGTLFGVNANAILVPNKLTGTLAYQVNEQKADDDSIDNKTQTLDMNVTWQAIEAKQNRPGLALWIQGQYQDIEDKVNVELSSQPFQVFVGATLSWPYSYPAAY
jgi:hypothetical protein